MKGVIKDYAKEYTADKTGKDRPVVIGGRFTYGNRRKEAMSKAKGVNKKTFIKNAMENRSVVGKSGVPEKLRTSSLNKGKWGGYIAKEDRKYARKAIKKNMAEGGGHLKNLMA